MVRFIRKLSIYGILLLLSYISLAQRAQKETAPQTSKTEIKKLLRDYRKLSLIHI